MTATGIDTADVCTFKDYSAFRSAGHQVAIRYLDPGTWKGVTRQEVNFAHSVGLAVGLVSETNPTHPSYFSHAQGVLDAHSSLSWANALGAPTNVTLWRPVDYEAAQGDLVAIGEYAKGYASVLGDRAGIYGDYRVIAYLKGQGIVKHLWQTYAWSYGQTVQGIDMLQYQNNVVIGGVTVDLNHIYDMSGFWMPKGSGDLAYSHIKVLVGDDKKEFDALVKGGRAHVLWSACVHLGATVKNLGGGKLDVNGTTLTCVIDGSQDYVLYEDLSPGHHIKVDHVNGEDWFTLAQTSTTIHATSIEVDYTDAQGNSYKVVSP